MTTIEEGKHEIESIDLPNAEIFRELAAHLENWANQHQEFLQLLDTGHSTLKDSWEGDGSDAYTLLHTRSQEFGNTHLEHFQTATHSLKQTANLVEEAHEKKSNAWKWIVGLTAAAVLTAGIALLGIPAVIAGVVGAVTTAASFLASSFGALLAGVTAIAALIVAAIAAARRAGIPRAGTVTIPSLTNTGNFIPSALAHIFFGDLNKKGKFGGFHYAAANAIGTIVKVISTNPDGVFTAQVTGPGGIAKAGNGGISTFFPVSMSPQDVVDAINTAYNNRVFVAGTKNTYEYTFPAGSPYAGMVIDMYLNAAGKIISAFPVK